LDASNCRRCNSACRKCQVRGSNQLTTENRRYYANRRVGAFIGERTVPLLPSGSCSNQDRGRRTSEAIVDKDNHARDACKYLVMSHPDPPGKTSQELVAEAVKPLMEAGDMTSAYVRYQQMGARLERQPIRIGRYIARRARRRC
jgi:hypothetical protein